MPRAPHAVEDDPERARRRLGIVALVVVALVFAGQLTALALGQTVLALVCFVLLIVAWFAFRSVVRRRGGPDA